MHLSHLHQLELSHDGYIPPRLIEAAMALDAIEAATRRPTAARIRTNVVRLKPAGHVEKLALAMVELSATRGAVTRNDLLRRGFTADELDQYGERAKIRAAEIKAGRETRQ